MREILFKAKRKDNGEWIEGLPSYGPDGKITELECLKKIPGEDIPEIEYIEIDPETLCQYTGLKDKNGERIFEGDIVRNKQGELRKVEYWPSMCRFVLVTDIGTWDGMEVDYDTDYDTQQLVCSELEVIGNIFDNPELIEEVEG